MEELLRQNADAIQYWFNMIFWLVVLGGVAVFLFGWLGSTLNQISSSTYETLLHLQKIRETLDRIEKRGRSLDSLDDY